MADDPSLPLALVIGPIRELERDRENRLYYQAMVEHRVDPRSVGEVYIVDLAAPPVARDGGGPGGR